MEKNLNVENEIWFLKSLKASKLPVTAMINLVGKHGLITMEAL